MHPCLLYTSRLCIRDRINLVTTTQSRLDESEFVNMILSQKIDGKVVGILHTLNDNLADVVPVSYTHLDVYKRQE